MDEVDYNAELSLLINEMQGEQGDIHEIYRRLSQLMSTMRAAGMPVPDDFKRLEAQLDKELSV